MSKSRAERLVYDVPFNTRCSQVDSDYGSKDQPIASIQPNGRRISSRFERRPAVSSKGCQRRACDTKRQQNTTFAGASKPAPSSEGTVDQPGPHDDAYHRPQRRRHSDTPKPKSLHAAPPVLKPRYKARKGSKDARDSSLALPKLVSLAPRSPTARAPQRRRLSKLLRSKASSQ